MNAPIAVATSDTSISVEWSAPAQPNGRVVKYQLHRDGTLICCNEDDAMTFNDTNLAPYSARVRTAFMLEGYVLSHVVCA
jgi:hypothetical protein